jgi:hypothetical protein
LQGPHHVAQGPEVDYNRLAAVDDFLKLIEPTVVKYQHLAISQERKEYF